MRLVAAMVITMAAVLSAQQLAAPPATVETTPQTSAQPRPAGTRPVQDVGVASVPSAPPDQPTGAEGPSQNTDSQGRPSSELKPLPAGTPITLPFSEDAKSRAEAKHLFDSGVKLKSSGKLEA